MLAQPVRVSSQAPVLPVFGYTFPEIAAAAPAISDAGQVLREQGADAIGMEGTPFAWANLTSETEARARVDEISTNAGAPVTFAGLAIIDAVRTMKAASVALLPTYYDLDWAAAWRGFVETCGVSVASSATMVEQGVVDKMTDEIAWDVPDDLLLKAVQHAGEGEIIVVTGAGVRVNRQVAMLEAASGRPVIGADTALFWALAKSLKAPLKKGALGALGDV